MIKRRQIQCFGNVTSYPAKSSFSSKSCSDLILSIFWFGSERGQFITPSLTNWWSRDSEEEEDWELKEVKQRQTSSVSSDFISISLNLRCQKSKINFKENFWSTFEMLNFVIFLGTLKIKQPLVKRAMNWKRYELDSKIMTKQGRKLVRNQTPHRKDMVQV